jgi:hypothetical protein
VISRPTTAQILDDCARELRETIAPAVTDATVRIRLQMLEQLVASCAVRAAHEISWMDAECSVMEAYAADVLGAFDDTQLLGKRLDDYRSERSRSLDLEDRVADYDRAGRAFAVALELAMHRGDEELCARAREIVTQRRNRETETRPGFYLPGRD